MRTEVNQVKRERFGPVIDGNRAKMHDFIARAVLLYEQEPVEPSYSSALRTMGSTRLITLTLIS